MLQYPVLDLGVQAQYPLSRIRRWRTLQTTTPGGYAARATQAEARKVEWVLDYRDLSETEAARLRDFFHATHGPLLDFLFIDPLANLVAASESLADPRWMRSPNLSLSEENAASDSPDRTFVLANTGQGVGELNQSVAAPLGATVCFSCEVQGPMGSHVVLSSCGFERMLKLTGGWQTVWVSAESTVESGVVLVGFGLPGGTSVRIRRVQAELQGSPSPYMPSTDWGATFPKTRFVEERLRFSVDGPGRNSVRVTLTSQVAE